MHHISMELMIFFSDPSDLLNYSFYNFFAHTDLGFHFLFHLASQALNCGYPSIFFGTAKQEIYKQNKDVQFICASFKYKSYLINSNLYIIKRERLVKMLEHKQKNWYIEYDYKTFEILFSRNFPLLIFKIADTFMKQISQEQLSYQSQADPIETKNNIIPKWIDQIAQAISQIIILLYNFFHVQENLTKDKNLKKQFSIMTTVFSAQNFYIQYFKERSAEFRINRITACCLRLNRFCQWIFETSNKMKQYTDKTLQDNLNEVYLFMQQRLRETLEITKQDDHELNLVMIDMLCMILRHNGDPTMKPFLDETKEKKLVDEILKTNEISQQFEVKKAEFRKQFEANRFFILDMGIQIDPKFNRHKQQSSEYSD